MRSVLTELIKRSKRPRTVYPQYSLISLSYSRIKQKQFFFDDIYCYFYLTTLALYVFIIVRENIVSEDIITISSQLLNRTLINHGILFDFNLHEIIALRTEISGIFNFQITAINHFTMDAEIFCKYY